MMRQANHRDTSTILSKTSTATPAGERAPLGSLATAPYLPPGDDPFASSALPRPDLAHGLGDGGLDPLRLLLALVGLPGPKEAPQPVLPARGTTWTWRWGTLWLMRLLIATKVPSEPVAACTARQSNWTARNKGPTLSPGRSVRVWQCARGTSRQCPGKRGRRSRNARAWSSSSTLRAGISPATTRQNRHSPSDTATLSSQVAIGTHGRRRRPNYHPLETAGSRVPLDRPIGGAPAGDGAYSRTTRTGFRSPGPPGSLGRRRAAARPISSSGPLPPLSSPSKRGTREPRASGSASLRPRSRDFATPTVGRSASTPT
jgi:hypothetical protein